VSIAITSLYAALLTFVFLALSVRVILFRVNKIGPSGPEGEIALNKSMRVQANFVEYAPLGLVLMLCAELQSAPALAIHAMGVTLLAGRVLHAIGMTRTPQVFSLRSLGILLTLLMLSLSAIALFGHALF
jgi:uncharacterized membrane protein YecN with MAPEG domain